MAILAGALWSMCRCSGELPRQAAGCCLLFALTQAATVSFWEFSNNSWSASRFCRHSFLLRTRVQVSVALTGITDAFLFFFFFFKKKYLENAFCFLKWTPVRLTIAQLTCGLLPDFKLKTEKNPRISFWFGHACSDWGVKMGNMILFENFNRLWLKCVAPGKIQRISKHFLKALQNEQPLRCLFVFSGA